MTLAVVSCRLSHSTIFELKLHSSYVTWYSVYKHTIDYGQVVQKPVSTNPRLDF